MRVSSFYMKKAVVDTLYTGKLLIQSKRMNVSSLIEQMAEKVL